MAKKGLNIVLKTEDEILENNIVGIVNDNTIKYNDNGVIVVIKKVNDEIIMIRENTEYQLVLKFKNKSEEKGIYLLKSNNIKLELNIFTKYLSLSDNKINIIYELNDELKEYSLLIKE